MITNIPGMHHVTAIAGDPQRNLDFYAGILGLRLVKLTVNFDDPGTYHFYYGDGIGRPGTILTFFPWRNAPRGRQGTGQAAVIALSIPAASLDYWTERLARAGVAFESRDRRFGEDQALALRDPDGLMLELVAGGRPDERPGWEHGAVPVEHAIRGLHAITLWAQDYAPTAEVLTETMGFREVGREGDVYRYAAANDAGPAALSGAIVDVRHMPGAASGNVAVGTVHHVAFRTADDVAQRQWQDRIRAAGLYVTPVQDRQYFHSIYYREPGHVLFEIATDPPGFATDEPVEHLGEHLRLPPWLEPQRSELQRILQPLRLPTGMAIG